MSFTKEDLVDLTKKATDAALQSVKGFTKEDLKRVSKEIEVLFKKIFDDDKVTAKDAKAALKEFTKTGKTDKIVPVLKSLTKLSKEDLLELGKKVAELALLAVKGITKEDIKRLSKEVEVFIKKAENNDKLLTKEAKAAIKEFSKTGKTDLLVEVMKKVKTKFL